MPVLTDDQWIRKADGSIDVMRMVKEMPGYSTAGFEKKIAVRRYVDLIETMRPIKSRQLAAVVIATSVNILWG